LAIETSLYYDARSEKYQIIHKQCFIYGHKKIVAFPAAIFKKLICGFLAPDFTKNRAINAKYTDRNSLTPRSKVRLLLQRHRLNSQLLVEIRWKSLVSCCIRIGWRMW